MPEISAVIIVFNEAQNIRRCIDSVKGLVSEIIVIDSMSTDETAEICRSMGCTVVQREFDGFGTQKQFAVDQASNDWVFSIDADEEATPELCREIRSLFDQSVVKENGFKICISLVYLGKRLKHGGAGGDYHLRLFNRNHGGFTKVKVHEGIEIKGATSRLKGDMLHYSYRDLAHHIEKLNFYTSRAAEEYLHRGKKFPRCWVALKFPISFLQFYCCKGGFLDGYPGFVWSLLAALYASLKIAKLIEMREKEA